HPDPTDSNVMKRINWPLWLGFILTFAASLSYPFFFVNWPITRDFPWATLLLFVVAGVFLFIGLKRAFAPDRKRKSKIAGVVVTAFSVLIFGLFTFSIF